METIDIGGNFRYSVAIGLIRDTNWKSAGFLWNGGAQCRY